MRASTKDRGKSRGWDEGNRRTVVWVLVCWAITDVFRSTGVLLMKDVLSAAKGGQAAQGDRDVLFGESCSVRRPRFDVTDVPV